MFYAFVNSPNPMNVLIGSKILPSRNELHSTGISKDQFYMNKKLSGKREEGMELYLEGNKKKENKAHVLNTMSKTKQLHTVHTSRQLSASTFLSLGAFRALYGKRSRL